MKLFEFDARNRSFADKVSGVVPTNTNCTFKRTEKGHCANFSATSDFDNFGIVSGVKTIVLYLKPSTDTKILQDNGVDKFEITGGNYSGTGVTNCLVNNVVSTAAIFGLWQVVIVEFSGGIDFATDLEIDVTAQIYAAKIVCYNEILTAAKKAEIYNEFLHSSPTSSPNITRPEVPCSDIQPLFVENGFNLCPDGTTYTAGKYLKSCWYVSSGSFKVEEDSTGKYLLCVTNGVLQWRGYNLSTYTADGFIKQCVGDISSDQGKFISAASYVAWTNNIVSVTLTAGQKLYKLVITKAS